MPISAPRLTSFRPFSSTMMAVRKNQSEEREVADGFHGKPTASEFSADRSTSASLDAMIKGRRAEESLAQPQLPDHIFASVSLLLVAVLRRRAR